MADSTAFELACEMLEHDTSLDRLEARGTIRLVLKSAGLDASRVTPDQLAVVVAKLLPHELQSRGVADGDGLCRALGERLTRLKDQNAAETPESVFARLGG
jgi:hypothetical protein